MYPEKCFLGSGFPKKVFGILVSPPPKKKLKVTDMLILATFNDKLVWDKSNV